jgi:muconate cycloisomerase
MSGGDFRLTSTIVDLPTRRRHAFATAIMARQSLVIVELHHDGLTGIGEGVVPGGPWWSGESVETIKLMIDTYLAPALHNAAHLAPLPAIAAMNRAVAGNHFAKSAVEMALWDLVGQRTGVPLAELLGGAHRRQMPIIWALSAADDDGAQMLAEAEQRSGEGFGGFKFKMGAREVSDDVDRVIRICEKLPEHATVVVDPNGSWDEIDAAWALGRLAGEGVSIAEQPVAGWNLGALARLRGQPSTAALTIMADESAQSDHDIVELIRTEAVSAVSIKIPKGAGIAAAAAMAATAVAGGVALYGGSTLESSIGAAASAALYATWPSMLGCELVGPLLLGDEVVTTPLTYQHGSLQLPTGAGLGVTLDKDKLNFYARQDD